MTKLLPPRVLHLMVAVGLFCLPACPNTAAQAEDSSKALRKLVFPANVSYGDLYSYSIPGDPDTLPNADGVRHDRGRFLGKAMGTVILPPSKSQHIYFFPSYELINHPEVLNTIAPDQIECLAFIATAVLQPIDKTIAPIAHLTGLRRLEIDAAELTDAQLAPLKALPNLEYLSAVANTAHGDCFKDFACKNKLKSIDLTFNPISKPAIAYLTQFKNLENLSLSQCSITDSDLPQLTKLTKLRNLSIGQSLVTSKGLSTLAGMKSLRMLDVNGSKLSVHDLAVLKNSTIKTIKLAPHWYSAKELQALQVALPNIAISIPRREKNVDSDTKTLFGPLH
jgi:hypothetical protein